MKARVVLISLVYLFLSSMSLFAENMKSLEFKNQEIRDILIVLAELNNVSIIPDETIQGKASFYFANMDFDAAFKLFADSNNLHYWKKNGIYYVSRIQIDQDSNSGLMSVQATEVSIKSLVTAISTVAGRTILYDQLPPETISVHAEGISIKDALDIIVAKYPSLSIDVRDHFFYIQKRDERSSTSAKPDGSYFTVANNLYSISIDKAKMRDVVLNLFTMAKKEVVFLMDQDAMLEDLNFTGKSFEDMLRLLLLKAGGDFAVSGDIYYIMAVEKKDLEKKFLTTLIVPLQYISIAEFQRIVPPNLNTSNSMKLDEKGNRVILNGTMEELKPILDFITVADSDKVTESTIRIDLSYLKSDEAIPLLPIMFSSFGPVPLPSKTGFLITLPEKEVQRLRDFVALIDTQDQIVPITLNYIKSDDLLAALPPSVTDQNVKKSTDPRVIFFKGTNAQRSEFLRNLAVIDRPKPQIKYQLLVLEVEDTDANSWSAGITVTPYSGPLGASLVQGVFQNALNLSFDVVGVLGASFGASLQWQMSLNKANVVADTTLEALSGEKITFKNTTTIRVNDTELSSTSGTTTTTPVVRDISSGLIATIQGWESGNRMITMNIDATLSKNVDGTSTNSLPTTTEKQVTTTARTEVGKPISVTGLKQRQMTENDTKVPLLGDIPLLGKLFQSKTYSMTDTNYLVYIIPYIEAPEVNREMRERGLVEDYYKYLFAQDEAPQK